MDGLRRFTACVIVAIIGLVCTALAGIHPSSASAQAVSPTATYDPLAQPPLPEKPTELELGRYLFWRHCMPCHGDRGQGLTDEFRALWEDHQNCWERGCHSGRWAEDSFPIPTVVPAIVSNDGLSRFASRQGLFEYLRTTHPPQHPGALEEEEYRSLAAFIFTLNQRSPDETAAPASPVASETISPVLSTASPALSAPRDASGQPTFWWWIPAGIGLALLAAIVIRTLNRNGNSDDTGSLS